MEKARLTVDVDPGLRRRVRAAAAVRGESLKGRTERALLWRLEAPPGDEAAAPEGAKVLVYYPATGPEPGE